MATSKVQLKQWFMSGLKPLQAQYHAWIDSFWHKDDSIPTSSITNLDTVLGDLVTINQFNNLTNLLLPQDFALDVGYTPITIGLNKLLEVIVVQTSSPISITILHNGTTEILKEDITDTTVFRLDRFIIIEDFIVINVTGNVNVKIYTR